MSDKTIKITGVPDSDDYRTRILSMADAAKNIAWHGGGGPMPEDHVFIRAAMAIDDLLRHGQGQEASLTVCLTAGQFFGGPDDDAPARREILSATLHDPATNLADMVANNRRLLGLPPQDES